MQDFEYLYKAEVIAVVDGDTATLRVDCGFGLYKVDRFRILDLDTPEVYGVKHDSAEYAAGLAASEAADSLLPQGAEVTIQTHKDKQGKYGRYLARITLADGTDYAARMIAMGHQKNAPES